jgi:DNA-directed RNA polymerase I, II, and III subunit RPABC2
MKILNTYIQTMNLEKYLTRYEKVRVIGQRAEQIARGAPSTVDITGINDPIEIAMKELRERKLPLKIHRKYPNGDEKVFSVAEMEYDD